MVQLPMNVRGKHLCKEDTFSGKHLTSKVFFQNNVYKGPEKH